MEVNQQRLAAAMLLCTCLTSAACQAPPAGPSEGPANSSQPPSHASAAAPSDVPQQLSCEMAVLSALGWQQPYNSNGYSINVQLPANCTKDTWQSLGCLQSLTNLTLIGNLSPFQLPDSWATAGCFPALVSLNLSATALAGSLPSSWATPEAFPQLQVLSLIGTQVTGTLLPGWAQKALSVQLPCAVANRSVS